jgi:tetratricopeptide (TPR) repeat protein
MPLVQELRPSTLLQARLASERPDWPEAERLWKLEAANLPASEEALFRLGEALRQIGKLSDADEVLGEAITRFPANEWAAVNYAWVAEQWKDWDEALLRWQSMLARFPEHQIAMIGVGKVLLELGRLEAAETILANAIAVHPGSRWSLMYHASAAVRRRDWNEALARWLSMAEHFPHDCIALTGQGEALRHLDRHGAADEVLADAISRNPDDQWPAIHYAINSEARADWAEALERWQAALLRFPDHFALQIGTVRALIELGQLDEANAKLAELAERFPFGTEITDLQSEIVRRRRTPMSISELVRDKIREDNIETQLPDWVSNPEVMIEITSICNFACSYCVSPMKLREKKIMSMETFHSIVKQISTMTTRPVRLHIDGEPTSHPNFLEMAKLVNSYGLPIALATNGSLLDAKFLGIRMNPLISMSTSVGELVERHKKLKFEEYIDRIVRYVSAWSNSDAEQNLFFQIVHYPQIDEAADKRYKAEKNEFLQEFCRRSELYDTCDETSGVEATTYSLRRKRHPGTVSFIKQVVVMGGLYPVDGKMVEQERVTEGFCDFPWRLLTIHSDGSLGACCVDLSGGTTFASPKELQSKSIKELWQTSPRIQRLREAFLDGRVDIDVCQRCDSPKQWKHHLGAFKRLA